jgi:uncharacterized protein YjbI with pentapeptide repeats
MVNEEHLALLRQGVEAWNQWRENNHEILADLSEADLSRANLTGADLRGVNLRGADLRMANLTEANLTGADLGRAILSGANFRMAKLDQANLTEANLNGAYLSLATLHEANLSGANLTEANLRIATLSEADLNGANLAGANLTGANLERTLALDTNFNKAILTATCLEDWQTNSRTNLDDVICDYVYLRQGQQERAPSDGNFAPREFTKLFQKPVDRVESIFSNKVEAVQEHQRRDDIDNYTSPPNYAQAAAEIPRSNDIDNYASQPNCAETAAEIQQLLQLLGQTYLTNTPLEKLEVVAEAIKHIESNPPLKVRVVKALKVDGTEALRYLIAHPLVNILLAAVEGWQEVD